VDDVGESTVETAVVEADAQLSRRKRSMWCARQRVAGAQDLPGASAPRSPIEQQCALVEPEIEIQRGSPNGPVAGVMIGRIRRCPAAGPCVLASSLAIGFDDAR
jgi:hypothetical protein